MKQSHTPGPWIFHRAGTFDILTDAKTGQELGQMSLTKEERDLIAAAPELLEALEHLFAQLEAAAPELRRMVNYNEIEQAIAKVRGES